MPNGLWAVGFIKNIWELLIYTGFVLIIWEVSLRSLVIDFINKHNK